MKDRPIYLDRKRVIRFTRNSVTLAENLLNTYLKDFPSTFEDIIAHIMLPPPSFEKATLFLWIALLDDDPKLTLFDVRNMVTDLAGSKDLRRQTKRAALTRFPFLCNAALKDFRRESEEDT